MNNIVLRCDHCSFKTYAKSRVVQHVKNHFADVSELLCSFCSKICTSIDYRKTHERLHMKRKGPKGKFVCETCGKVFALKFKLDKHFKNVHITGNFPCNECDQVFKVKQLLYQHKECHGKDKEIACEICGKLVKKRSYRDHLTYHGAPKLKCSVEGCTKMFFRPTEVVRHIKNYHEESKNIKCPECASVFPNEGNLKRHMSRSHAAPSFFCEVEGCSYKQTRRDYLKLHLKNHRDIEPILRDALLKKLGGRSKKYNTGP